MMWEAQSAVHNLYTNVHCFYLGTRSGLCTRAQPSGPRECNMTSTTSTVLHHTHRALLTGRAYCVGAAGVHRVAGTARMRVASRSDDTAIDMVCAVSATAVLRDISNFFTDWAITSTGLRHRATQRRCWRMRKGAVPAGTQRDS